MKKLFFIVTLLLVVVLSAGVSWAKPGGVANKGADKASVASDNASVAGDKASSVTIDKAGTASDKTSVKISVKNKALGQLKDNLNAVKDKDLELGNNFKDIEDHWAKSAILKMSAIGVFKGDGDGTFRPDDPITQVEVVALAARISNYDEVPQANDLTENDLVGVPDWAKVSVCEAVYNGVINLNRFHSSVQASRVQAAVMIAKAIKLQPVDTSDMPFNDKILISQEDAGYIMALYQQGIILGNPDGKFNPNSAITRAEISTIMERVIDNSGEDSETTQTSTESSGTTQ
ncbi:S-layer homology domain-containing protein [Pelotomaculum isophthalicicum JI]|uniref:S-layer homology domain-containing protein n=1 Tax=Pelotomaculum isophthalicicum JI TaxID=947010 RepID=A0A9X4JWJ0_9FIRM|nr:S-layer homology domain-containing protein [Pelotomaculum isophthalicicum]MDF9409432.1 S-layer homology domain-containing protein [Pelotomaculum isophthalicicum JI]